MTATLTRSTDELVRLTNDQWRDSSFLIGSGLYAVLANASAASTPPTATTSFATWRTYFLRNNIDNDYMYALKTPLGAVYNATNGRAEVPAIVFNQFYLIDLPSGSHTVTHVVLTDNPYTNSGRIYALIEESPALSINSSSSLSYTLNAWGQYAA